MAKGIICWSIFYVFLILYYKILSDILFYLFHIHFSGLLFHGSCNLINAPLGTVDKRAASGFVFSLYSNNTFAIPTSGINNNHPGYTPYHSPNNY